MAEELKLESKRGALVTAVEKDGPRRRRDSSRAT